MRLVLIAGASGSGKTTLAQGMQDRLPGLVRIIAIDCFYRDDLANSENFDCPDAIDWPLLLAAVQTLMRGVATTIPQYDYCAGRRCGEEQVAPPEVLILEGIFALCSPVLREMATLRLFVATDLDTALIRRLRRDIAERGRTLEEILRRYETQVKPAYDRWIHPSARDADMVIPHGGQNTVALDLIIGAFRSEA